MDWAYCVKGKFRFSTDFIAGIDINIEGTQYVRLNVTEFSFISEPRLYLSYLSYLSFLPFSRLSRDKRDSQSLSDNA
jgi:hypothetical protein